MTAVQPASTDRLLADAESQFAHWDLVREVVDELIDLSLNYRQSGHPGGSRSKVHLLLALMLSGAMRWDIRRPWRPFADRFVLSAGHTVPLVYATLAVLNETLRARSERDADPAFQLPDDGRWAMGWEDLLLLRRRGGLAGHAEMEGKTLFLKWNTGPSGHGMPPSAGEAVALKLAGCEDVKVFVVEGEGGLTPGASHETRAPVPLTPSSLNMRVWTTGMSTKAHWWGCCGFWRPNSRKYLPAFTCRPAGSELVWAYTSSSSTTVSPSSSRAARG